MLSTYCIRYGHRWRGRKEVMRNVSSLTVIKTKTKVGYTIKLNVFNFKPITYIHFDEISLYLRIHIHIHKRARTHVEYWYWHTAYIRRDYWDTSTYILTEMDKIMIDNELLFFNRKMINVCIHNIVLLRISVLRVLIQNAQFKTQTCTFFLSCCCFTHWYVENFNSLLWSLINTIMLLFSVKRNLYNYYRRNESKLEILRRTYIIGT